MPNRPSLSPALRVLLPLVAGLLFGCSSDNSGFTPCTSDADCPDGVCGVSGFCVSGADGGRGGGGGGRGGGGGTTDVGDTGGGGGDDADGTDGTDGTSCEPFERICENAVTAAECSAAGDGFTSIPCPDGQVCEGGICIEGEVEGCTPGEVLRCASPDAQLVCAADGENTESRPCPAESPFCRDGDCTDRLCDPGVQRCDGDNIVECAEDGRSEFVVETCEVGCSRGVCIDPCAGDGKSYVGCGFFAVDLDNFGTTCTSDLDCGLGESCIAGICDPSAASQQFAVTVSNGAAEEVEVTVFNGSDSEVATQRIAVGQLATIPLPRLDVNDSSRSFNSYRIESTGPVTVHQFNPQNNSGVFSNDASLLLPATSLGTEYIVTGWPSQAEGAVALKGFVTIVAVAEGTTEINVTTPIATLAGPGSQPPAMTAGGSMAFELERGEVLSFSSNQNGADFTGMEIVSSNPVAVFAGSECANVPLDNQYCDHIEQQLFPVDTWDRDFVVAKFARRGTEPDVWRIMASVDGTVIRLNPSVPGVDGITLNRGEFTEFESTRNHYIAASHPVSVAQFMVGSSYPGSANGCDRNPIFGDSSGCAIPGTCDSGSGIGDPAFLMNVPRGQFREDYIVLTPTGYEQDFLTIVAPEGASVTIDGAAVPGGGSETLSVESTLYRVYRAPVAPGVHRVEADVPVGLYAYGYDCDVSYAYPGGLNLDTLR